MATTHKYTQTIVRASAKKLDPDFLADDVRKIMDKAVTKGRQSKGWKVRAEYNNWKPIKVGDALTYRVDLSLTCKPLRERKAELIENEFHEIRSIIDKTGKSLQWASVASVAASPGREAEYADVKIEKNWANHFSHVYDRQDQIEIVLSAIRAGYESNWENRFHVVLHGPPACGKTEIMSCVKSMIGADGYMEYDATATTQAGAIKDLDERIELPRLMVVEELEKVDEGSLRWMLSVLDHRAEIRKTTYRGVIQRSTKLLCLATVNDYELFGKMMYGALASRFAHHVYCPRPSRKILQRILDREVQKEKGDARWIKPAIDFCEQHGITDPRKATAICLCGREKLLTGEYQKRLVRTAMPEAK